MGAKQIKSCEFSTGAAGIGGSVYIIFNRHRVSIECLLRIYGHKVRLQVIAGADFNHHTYR